MPADQRGLHDGCRKNIVDDLGQQLGGIGDREEQPGGAVDVAVGRMRHHNGADDVESVRPGVLECLEVVVRRGCVAVRRHVEGEILIGHGRSTSKAIRNAIRFADSYASSGVIERIGEKILDVLDTPPGGRQL